MSPLTPLQATDSALCSDWSGGAHHSLCRKVRIWSQFKSKTAWSWKKIISSVLTIPEGGGRGEGGDNSGGLTGPTSTVQLKHEMKMCTFYFILKC